MTIEHLTIRKLIDMLVSEPSKHVNNMLYSSDQVNPKTRLQFYHLKGYDLQAMEIETVLFTDWDGEPVVEITVKGVGTDEGGNDPDEDVGVSLL